MNDAKWANPTGLTKRERALLDAIRDGRHPREVRFPDVHQHDNHRNVDKELRILEARRLVTMTYDDGTPRWVVAPVGPWTLSRAQAVQMRKKPTRNRT